MATSLFGTSADDSQPICSQSALDFPQSLAEKYRPAAIGQFCGLDKVKKILSTFVTRPSQTSAWLFVGPPGVGKTTMALAMAEAIPAELHHIPSRKCDLETVDSVTRGCHFMPWTGKRLHLVLVDEADQMTEAAQLAFLSKLDSTAHPPNTCFVFTANDTSRLQDRFLSRCRVLEFSSYGIAADIVGLLQRVWAAECAGLGITAAALPNFQRMAKDSKNNVRDALMQLEIALLGV